MTNVPKITRVMWPWRDLICETCRDRGRPRSEWYFYGHLFGEGHDHRCVPLTKDEIAALVREEIERQRCA